MHASEVGLSESAVSSCSRPAWGGSQHQQEASAITSSERDDRTAKGLGAQVDVGQSSRDRNAQPPALIPSFTLKGQPALQATAGCLGSGCRRPKCHPEVQKWLGQPVFNNKQVVT